MVTLSIVSHGHGSMLQPLVERSLSFPEVGQILVTLNVDESVDLPRSEKIRIVRNSSPKGFGANHNAAFRFCTGSFFCPLNPDISYLDNPFPALIEAARRTEAAIVAPRVISSDGRVEDNMRQFPTVIRLCRKIFLGERCSYDLQRQDDPRAVEWFAGMFMLFTRDRYQSLGGFDERYFMYYEDVDICLRAWRSGSRVMGIPGVTVVHDAQRSSHHNLRHMLWHASSMARFLFKYSGRLPEIDCFVGKP